MKRDFIGILREKLQSHGIKGKDLAVEAGRTPQNISEVLNRKVSPSIDSFNELLEACERLSPGFADDFYMALIGQVDLFKLVSSLTSSQLGQLLVISGNRLSEKSQERNRQLVAS